MKLKHVARFLSGGTPDTANPEMWADDGDVSGIPWVSIGDMSSVDVVRRTSKRITPSGLESSRLRIGTPGIVLYAMYASVGAVARLGIDASWNQAILGIEVIPEAADSRFTDYWLRHMTPIALAEVRSATQDNLNLGQVANFPFPQQSLIGQRRIAEFLDDRVARIDKIIAARRQQLDHLEAMTGSLFLDVLRARGLPAPTSVEAGWDRAPLPPGWRSTHLGRVLRQLTNGFVGPTRDILVDSGIPYIQSVHIKNGQIQFARRPFYVSADWHGARPRINLRAGDVLIVQTGDVGQVALVPERYGPASCHALLIARVHPKVISPAFLTEALRSSFGYQCMLSRATGALHPHLEAGVRSTPLVLPPLDEQDELVTRIAQRRATLQEGANYVRRSIDLLTEYKQSLITAAVTGELDVTTASKALLE